MHFHHPPAKKYRLLAQGQSPMETIVLHLTPYGIGQMGGEMAKRMVEAAQGYLQEVTARELRKAFRQEVYHDFNSEQLAHPSFNDHSGGEVHANQYPSGNGTH